MQLTEQEIRQALMQAGYILPTNEAAIAALDLSSPVDPDAKLSPELSFDRIMQRIESGVSTNSKILKLAVIPPSPAAEGLARAARNGDELSPEIIALMEADRNRLENIKD